MCLNIFGCGVDISIPIWSTRLGMLLGPSPLLAALTEEVAANGGLFGLEMAAIGRA
jgi:hypothetical protein